MQPNFWKLSQGTQFFSYSDILRSIEMRLVYVHKDTSAKGQSSQTQGQDFIAAPVGDYFYLTHGNSGIYLLGQFVGPANIFSEHKEGWMDRQFRLIFPALSKESYSGAVKWWTPNDNSTFIRVPSNELPLFEDYILKPLFGIKLSDYGI
jgi:hypothetical protein